MDDGVPVSGLADGVPVSAPADGEPPLAPADLEPSALADCEPPARPLFCAPLPEPSRTAVGAFAIVVDGPVDGAATVDADVGAPVPT